MHASLVLFVVLAVIADKISAIPSDIERCTLSDERCLSKAANRVLKRYFQGNAELNMPSIDPMYIDYVKIVRDAGLVTVRGSANESYASGLSKGKIEKIGGFDKGRLQIKFKTPKLFVNGSYKSIAHVVSIPINGDGKYKIVFNNFDVTLEGDLTRFENNGKEYFKVTKTTMEFKSSGGELNISDFGSFINSILNGSFNLIKTELSDVISKVWSSHFQKVLNSVLSKNSIDELFLT